MLRRKALRSCAMPIAAMLSVIPAAYAAKPQSHNVSPNTVQSKRSEAPPTRQLYLAGTVPFSAPPPMAIVAGVQCDADGNIYARYSPALPNRFTLPKLPLTRISLMSRSVVQFHVPTPDGYAFVQSQGFYVEPDGSVYGLLAAYRQQPGPKAVPNFPVPMVVRYQDDGAVDSVIRLQLPQGVHVQPFRLAVFPDGHLLMTGLVMNSPGRLPPSTGVFTGIFDRGGGYAGPLTLPDDVKPEPMGHVPVFRPGVSASPGNAGAKGIPTAPHKSVKAWFLDVMFGLTLGSPDGDIYLIRAGSPARVYVLSSGGTVLRRLMINPPVPGMIPSEASLTSVGALLLQFSQPMGAENAQPSRVLALADPSTGKITETYKAPPRAGAPACVSPEDEILFLREGKAGHLEVAEYLPR